MNKYHIRPIEERFLGKVAKSLESGCWLWKAKPNSNGYGQFYTGSRKGKTMMSSAHRFSYEYFIGKIPKGLVVDHLCRNRICVNPKHLELITAKENTRRGTGFAGVNARKTHCINGHPFKGHNVEIVVSRRCRICNSIKSMKAQKKYRDSLKVKKTLFIAPQKEQIK